jgi:aspartyl-tRNA(Asn)/glutamyl-tRNA(Gln) amidotransferase subunit A
VTATPATRDALDRIARHNPRLHAFAHVAPEAALEQARHIDAMAALGVHLPLAGMVVGVKDIIDVAGQPTGGGSLSRAAAAPAARDAIVARRLRAAGAVLVGKTHTVEYAFGGWGTNVSVGTPRNPYDLETPRAPGGSSSGSGVAVAAGLVAAALGSDTGGSVRLPASFCGTVGLKTTAGLLPLDGVLPLGPRFDTIGPLGRSVADTARVFAALLGDDAGRIAGGAAVAADPPGQAPRGHAGLRIGVPELPDVKLHADTARVFDDTRKLLESLGATLLPARLPRNVGDYAAALGELIAAVGYMHYGALAEAEPSLLGAPVRRRMLSGRDLPAHRLLAEYQRQSADIFAMTALFAGVDALLTPTTAAPAPRLSEVDEAVTPALLTRFVNYLDLAAISLPMARSAEGLPIGMQIVVPGWHEVRALTIAAALEAARGGPLLLDL